MTRWVPALILALGVTAAWPQGAAEEKGKAAPGAAEVPEAQEAPMLKPGDVAPPFSLPGSDGSTHALADQAGKSVVVLAWFPKAFTGG